MSLEVIWTPADAAEAAALAAQHDTETGIETTE